MHRFYDPDIEETHTLPEVESGHCARVLRLKEGDAIEAVDGKGNCHECHITLAHHKRCAVEIDATHHSLPHWGSRIVVAIAPTKNLDRMEWLAEKVTEMGIDRIIPLKCRYSERKELKTERIGKILVSAMKQSLKTVLPALDEMTPVIDVINAPFAGEKYIAYCDSRIGRKLFADEFVKKRNTLIMIGPEGDFSTEEIEAALRAGFKPVSFGESRLRTETAAMYAVAAVHAMNQIK